MASSVLMKASHEHNTNLTLSEGHHLHHHHHRHRRGHHQHPDHVQTKTEGMRNDHCRAARQKSIPPRRKLARGNDGKKKEPQRGMGVEQLERLRLGVPDQISHNSTTVVAAALPASLNTVPLHLAKYGANSSSNNSTPVAGVGGLNLNQTPAFWVPRVGLFYGQGLVSDENFQGNLYGSEICKELSSTPNMINSYPDRCSVCHQTKRIIVAQNLMYQVVKDTNMEMPSSAPSSDFIGLNVGNSQNNKGRTALVYGKNGSFHGGSPYSVSNIDQGIIDVVAVHRKGSGSSPSGDGNGSFFMEYEFFPVSEKGCGNIGSRGSSENELTTMMKKNGVGSGGGDASCITTTTTTNYGDGVGFVDASSSIDLSLRLSY